MACAAALYALYRGATPRRASSVSLDMTTRSLTLGHLPSRSDIKLSIQPRLPGITQALTGQRQRVCRGAVEVRRYEVEHFVRDVRKRSRFPLRSTLGRPYSLGHVHSGLSRYTLEVRKVECGGRKVNTSILWVVACERRYVRPARRQRVPLE